MTSGYLPASTGIHLVTRGEGQHVPLPMSITALYALAAE